MWRVWQSSKQKNLAPDQKRLSNLDYKLELKDKKESQDELEQNCLSELEHSERCKIIKDDK